MSRYYDIDFIMEIIENKLDEAKQEILNLENEVPSAVVNVAKLHKPGKTIEIPKFVEKKEDVVEVRCKTCKYRHTYECPIGLWVDDNWFCYRGETE